MMFFVSNSGYADTISGMIVKIEGQRITVQNDLEEVIVSVSNPENFKIGDYVEVS